MNIFLLDLDPRLAAYQQCDKHVIKMTLETAQILSSASIINGGKGPYRLTHKNHPCTLWAAQTSDNYEWLIQ